MISRIRFIRSSLLTEVTKLTGSGNEMKAKITFTVDQEVIKEIDAHRGLATRSAFANQALKLGLRAYKATNRQTRAPYPATNIKAAEENNSKSPT